MEIVKKASVSNNTMATQYFTDDCESIASSIDCDSAMSLFDNLEPETFLGDDDNPLDYSLTSETCDDSDIDNDFTDPHMSLSNTQCLQPVQNNFVIQELLKQYDDNIGDKINVSAVKFPSLSVHLDNTVCGKNLKRSDSSLGQSSDFLVANNVAEFALRSGSTQNLPTVPTFLEVLMSQSHIIEQNNQKTNPVKQYHPDDQQKIGKSYKNNYYRKLCDCGEEFRNQIPHTSLFYSCCSNCTVKNGVVYNLDGKYALANSNVFTKYRHQNKMCLGCGKMERLLIKGLLHVNCKNCISIKNYVLPKP